MGVDKIIVRAILSTLAAIGVLLVFLLLSLCLFFPATMMDFSYRLGMEDTSIHFAKRAYKESDDIYYIAYATEVAIAENKTGKILSCGERLLADEGFEAYSQAKGEDYKTFVYGQISVAKYAREDIDGAIELAYESLDGEFPAGNALVAVLAEAIENEDAQAVEAVKAKLQSFTAETLSFEDAAYLQSVLAYLNSEK